MKSAKWFIGGLLVAITAGVLAASGSGVPQFLRLTSLGVGATPPASGGIASSGTVALTKAPTTSLDGMLYLNGNIPMIGFNSTGDAAGSRVWDCITFVLQFRCRGADDAGGSNLDWLTVNRLSGSTSMTDITFRFPIFDDTYGTTSPQLQFRNATVFRGLIGSDSVVNSLCGGSAVGDLCIRSAGGAIRFSSDNGVTSLNVAPSSSSYTATVTGCTTSPTPTVFYTKFGNIVTIQIPAQTCTSNAVGFTMTGAPAAIRPTSNPGLGAVAVLDNTATYTTGFVQMGTGGTLTFQPSAAATTWTAAGTKGVGGLGASGSAYTYALVP